MQVFALVSVVVNRKRLPYRRRCACLPAKAGVFHQRLLNPCEAEKYYLSPGVLQNSSLTPPPQTNAMLVRSSTGKVGAGKLIKVMAGDRIHTSVQYYYPTVGTQPAGNGLNTLLGSLASVIGNSAGSGTLLKTASASLAQGVGLDPAVVALFNGQNNTAQPGKPKAYLNVLFFDEQFNMDANASQYRQVGTGTMNPANPGQIGFMAGSAALAKKSGYCYIYISNESNDLVYFDNFTLAHERSSLMEEMER